MKRIRFFILPMLMLIIVLSSCNIPKPQQFPGEPSPDLGMIQTEIADGNQQSENNLSTETSEIESIPVITEVSTETIEPEASDILPVTPTATAEPTPEPTLEPTALPQKIETLTICLGKEPQTLFFYAESSQAMWSVLESIYDGPFDMGDGKAEAVIFDNITIESKPVKVMRGDIIVDSDGDAVEMRPGTVFMPAEPAENCVGKNCLSTWTSLTEEAELKQTTITFVLKEDLKWNDGTPLTAEDSVYSMTVNGLKGIKASKHTYNLTESYAALDDRTVEWRGLPGYIPDDPSEVFWTPLPSHTMKGMNADDLLASEAINQRPLGWGAWQIVSWEKGSSIVAERNPYYSFTEGNEPFFDRIVYRFYGRPGDNNVEALQNGSCDIIDTSVDLGADLEPILEDVRDGKMSVYIRPDLSRQEIFFNLIPPVNQWASVPLISQDLRAAILRGINRQAIIRQVLYGQSEVPVDFYPADHVKHNHTLELVAYDPDGARESLETQGWKIPEDQPQSGRIAATVPGLMYSTPLAFSLTIADTPFANKAAEMIRDDLAEIGIEVTIDALPLTEFYAQGPDGIVFGQKFRTAMFAWAGGNHPCELYASNQIPSAENHWVGTNVGSYANEEYDDACLFPDMTETAAAELFAADLPTIPLYFNISIAASSNYICGISDRIDSRSVLWNMEQFSRSEENCAVSQWNDIYKGSTN